MRDATLHHRKMIKSVVNKIIHEFSIAPCRVIHSIIVFRNTLHSNNVGKNKHKNEQTVQC